MNNPSRFPSDNQGWGDQGSTQNNPYTGQDNPYRDNPRMTQTFGRNRGRGAGCCMPLVILAVVAIFALSMLWGFAPELFTRIQIPGITNNQASSVELPVPASGHPTILLFSDVVNSSQFVHNDVAPLHIHKGSDKKIQITATGLSTDTQADASTQIIYKQTADKSLTILHIGSQYSGTIDIVLPAHSDINAHSNASSITVDGLSGQMHLDTLDGAITVKNSSINGASLLVSNNGTVKTEQSSLSGPVTYNDNTGPIIFNGTINPQGDYHFNDNSGTVDITLPNNAAFHLDAKVANSNLRINFPGIQVQQNEAHSDTGSAPRAQLTIDGNQGNVQLQGV